MFIEKIFLLKIYKFSILFCCLWVLLCFLVTDQLAALTVHVNDQNKRRRQILNEFLDLKG